jgi:hypothetical protein
MFTNREIKPVWCRESRLGNLKILHNLPTSLVSLKLYLKRKTPQLYFRIGILAILGR